MLFQFSNTKCITSEGFDRCTEPYLFPFKSFVASWTVFKALLFCLWTWTACLRILDFLALFRFLAHSLLTKATSSSFIGQMRCLNFLHPLSKCLYCSLKRSTACLFRHHPARCCCCRCFVLLLLLLSLLFFFFFSFPRSVIIRRIIFFVVLFLFFILILIAYCINSYPCSCLYIIPVSPCAVSLPLSRTIWQRGLSGIIPSPPTPALSRRACRVDLTLRRGTSIVFLRRKRRGRNGRGASTWGWGSHGLSSQLSLQGLQLLL